MLKIKKPKNQLFEDMLEERDIEAISNNPPWFFTLIEAGFDLYINKSPAKTIT